MKENFKMQITLNDFFNISKEDQKNVKIAICKTNGKGGKYLFEQWVENKDVSYAYHYKNGRGNAFKKGNICFGFVQKPDCKDKYLLVTVGKIISIPNSGSCEFQEIDKYKKFFGRLFIRLATGRQQLWCFNYSTFCDKAVVEEIIPSVYEDILPLDVNSLNISYKELQECVDGISGKMDNIRNFLSNVKGVYLLTDMSTGKLYVGSATGENGVLGRWTNYKESKTGGNKKLIKLLKEKGEEYFIKNFRFTLIEWFGSNQTDKDVLERESYWKKVLDSNSEFGYNDN